MKGGKVMFARFGHDTWPFEFSNKKKNKGNVQNPKNSNHILPVVQKISISYYYSFLWLVHL